MCNAKDYQHFAGPSQGLGFPEVSWVIILQLVATWATHYPVQISIHFKFSPQFLIRFPFLRILQVPHDLSFRRAKSSSSIILEDVWCVAGLPLADASGLHHWQWQRPRP